MMASSYSNQIKSTNQQQQQSIMNSQSINNNASTAATRIIQANQQAVVGYSPKTKIQIGPNDQSPLTNENQRIISQKVIQFSAGSGSQSPEGVESCSGLVQGTTQTTTASGMSVRKPSGTTVMQRIQLKNVAFIPGKAPQQQSPQSSGSLQTSNMIGLNGGNDQAHNHIGGVLIKGSPTGGNTGGLPQAQIITTGQKMIIPAHQIKIVKKDGTSPSPEARGFFTLKQSSPSQLSGGGHSSIASYQTQVSGVQNQNQQPQQAFTIQKISNRIVNVGSGPTPTKHPQQIQQQILAQQLHHHQMSDDEATVRSDSGEGDKHKGLQNNLGNHNHQGASTKSGIHHQTTTTNSSHHSHSSNGGSVASGGKPVNHHHAGHHMHSSHHAPAQSVQHHQVQQMNNINFNRPKMSLQQQPTSTLNPSQQSQLLNSGENQKPPSLMRGLGVGDNQGATTTTATAGRGIKIISQNKIRQSPSPPPNLVINSQAPPTVTNIQVQMKQQQQQQQIQISQQNIPGNQGQGLSNNGQGNGTQQLATDFIKGMINQGRTGGASGASGILGQKKFGSGIQMLNSAQMSNGTGGASQGLSGCLKIKNTAITQPSGATPIGQGVNQNQPSFVKDMKKHGLIKDIQDVNSIGHMIHQGSNGVGSPQMHDEQPQTKHHQHQQPSISQKILHLRNYSPPPVFNPSEPANIQMVKENNLQKQNAYINGQAQGSNSHDYQDQNATGDSCNSNGQPNNNGQNQNSNQAGVFQFPFQRRARSLSIPKQDAAIQIKLKQPGAGPNVVPGIGSEAPGAPIQNIGGQNPVPQLQTKSPSPTGEDSRRNRPVVAKINFVIAQKGALGVNYRGPDDESVFERNKEVDEWLMGSGESDATAGSNNDKDKIANGNVGINGAQKQRNPSHHSQSKAKQNELERPVQPGIIANNMSSSDEEDGCDEDDDDWMFQTFTGAKKPMNSKGTNKQLGGGPHDQDSRHNPHHIHNQHDLDGGLGSSYEENSNSSPFDMPSEIMSKQFSKLGSPQGISASSIPQQSLHFGYPSYHQQQTKQAPQTSGGVRDLIEDDDCSKDLSRYISSIDELMGKMF